MHSEKNAILDLHTWNEKYLVHKIHTIVHLQKHEKKENSTTTQDVQIVQNNIITFFRYKREMTLHYYKKEYS